MIGFNSPHPDSVTPDLTFPSLSHIVDGLFVSGANVLNTPRLLHRAGITHILKLYAGDPYPSDDLATLEIPLPDRHYLPRADLNRGIDFIMRQVADENRVLVMCAAGISRSPAFVLAYLLENSYDAREANTLLTEQHPDTNIHSKLWASLIEHYELPYTLDDVMDF